MSRLAFVLAAAVVLLAGACGSKSERASTALPAVAAAPAPAVQTYTGEIMDSTCAAMGSHQTMEEGEGTKNSKDCVLKCAANGGQLVLYDASTRTTYKLDDQAKPRDFAGQKVKVTGTADIATKTIHVQRIEGA